MKWLEEQLTNEERARLHQLATASIYQDATERPIWSTIEEIARLALNGNAYPESKNFFQVKGSHMTVQKKDAELTQFGRAVYLRLRSERAELLPGGRVEIAGVDSILDGSEAMTKRLVYNLTGESFAECATVGEDGGLGEFVDWLMEFESCVEGTPIVGAKIRATIQGEEQNEVIGSAITQSLKKSNKSIQHEIDKRSGASRIVSSMSSRRNATESLDPDDISGIRFSYGYINDKTPDRSDDAPPNIEMTIHGEGTFGQVVGRFVNGQSGLDVSSAFFDKTHKNGPLTANGERMRVESRVGMTMQMIASDAMMMHFAHNRTWDVFTCHGVEFSNLHIPF